MLKKDLKKVFVSIIMAGTIFFLVTGCKNNNVYKTGSIKYEANDEIYPMKTDNTLSIWGLSTRYFADEIGETPLGKEWQRLTGVNVEFIQPVEDPSEALGLLIASGDLPDIIMADLYKEPGGIQKFADDNIIIELNEVISKYAPNLCRSLCENPDVDKMVKSDNGTYYFFPFIRGDEILTASRGLVVRKDLLDKEGLSVPETIDEWYQVLTYYKNTGASAPLSYNLGYEKQGIFLGAYGVKADFYILDGKVKYGFLEPKMKEAIANLKKWYSEGLLDENIIKVADLDSNVLTSETCATYMWGGSGIGRYMNAMKEKDPAFNLVPVKFPVLNKGDTPMFGSKEYRYVTENNAFITSDCENLELAARFLDFGYSEKGHMFFNFGIEGESYKMVDGYPKYTDLIINNPDGLSISNIMGKYMLSSASGPFVQDKRYIEQYYTLEQQKDALNVWAKTNALKYNIPCLSFTVEESHQISEIMNNIKPYTWDTIYKYIMGIESLEQYDQFISQLKTFGIDEAVSIYQSAVDRYNKR